MANEIWDIWTRSKDYGELLYKRATGESEEMESSKALCSILSQFYQKGMKIADIGCGAGHYLRSLRNRLDRDVIYTGVDATEQYLDLARKAFPVNAEFKLGDIFDLPLEDKSHDIVINNNVMLHLPPPPTKAFSELIRVARKHVVVRTVFGNRNYIIKEVREKEDGIEEVESSELELITREDELGLFNYFNMYKESYFRQLISKLDPNIRIDIVKDDYFASFDNKKHTTKTGTQVMGGAQVSGNLLLDWRFIVLTKLD